MLTRKELHIPVKAILIVDKTKWVEPRAWVPASYIAYELYKMGAIKSPCTRSVGDLLGRGKGGMNLPKKKIKGIVHYRLK